MDRSGDKDPQLVAILKSVAKQPNPGGFPGAHEANIQTPAPRPLDPKPGHRKWSKPAR